MSTEVIGTFNFDDIPTAGGTPVLLNAGGTPSVITDTFANRPAAGTAGRLFVDTTNNIIQRDTGSTWQTLGATGISILNKSITSQVVTTTATTNILNYTVPGGTLGTSNLMRISLGGAWQNTAGAGRNVTLAVNYGGSTLWQDTSGFVDSGDTVGWSIRLTLQPNDGSTTAQRLTGDVKIGGGGTLTTGVTGDLGTDEIEAQAVLYGTSAVNSALNQALTITTAFNGTGISWAKYFHLIELI